MKADRSTAKAKRPATSGTKIERAKISEKKSAQSPRKLRKPASPARKPRSAPKLFLSCEHAGNEIPAKFKKLFAKNRGVLQTHRGSDPGAFAVAKELERLTQTKLYYTKISRLIVDMNRSADSETVLSRWTKSLEPADQTKIFERYYWPYRKTITKNVQSNLKRKSDRLVHLGIHSFSPYLDPSRKSCDIGLLFDPKNKFEARTADLLCLHLSVLFPDLGIRMNFPYRGDADGLTTDLRNQTPPHRYAGLEIEFNQAFLKKLIAQKTIKSFAKTFAFALTSTLEELRNI